MSKKIIIVTPKFPFPAFGACEQDRAAGIELFLKNGWEVRVITKIYKEEYRRGVEEKANSLKIKVISVVYRYLQENKSRTKLGHFFRPWFWDGAAFEYNEPVIKKALMDELAEFKPDLVWFDYTYLWPLYNLVRKLKIPIITRSINFEPAHFLDEDGRNFKNYLKSIPKFLSEYFVAKMSDVLFAITPKEEKIYKRIGAKHVAVLPLRGLPRCLDWSHKVVDKKVLNVFFAGSTYNVSHNRAALEFLLRQVAPAVEKKFPGVFTFHILGKKFPNDLRSYLGQKIIYHDYLPESDYLLFLDTMDIAIAPSLCGGGMQQKVFEPLARGFPTLASRRSLVGYPFIDNKHVLLADTVEEFVSALMMLMDGMFRRKLSFESRKLSNILFSDEAIEKTLFDSFDGFF